MNRQKLIELAKQAGIGTEIHISPRQSGASEEHIWGGQMQTETMNRFAELIVKECVKQCQQEWYDLNNANDGVSDDARATAIRVGQKNGMLKAISKIKEHFGIE